MKKIGLAALAVSLMSSGAYAADAYYPSSTKDDPSYAPSAGVVNWTGFYIGGAVGYGNANHDLTVEQYNGAYCFDKKGTSDPVAPEDPTTMWNGGYENLFNDDGTCDTDEVAVDPSSRDIANLNGLNSSGLVGDVRAGFDVAQGRYLFGVFGSYGFNDMNTEGSVDFGPMGSGSFSIEKGEEWSIGARAGYIVAPRTLLYILAAYTQTEYEFGVSDGTDSSSKDVSFDGVTVGGGLEFAVTGNIFLGIEGTHTFYGEETIFDTGASDVGGFGHRLVDDLDETKVMGTLKIKLNTPLLD